jgi:hypothetical protein
MIEFRPTRHTVTGAEIIEVLVNGQFRAAIYPNGTGGFSIMSRYVINEPTPGDLGDGIICWQFRLQP